MAKMLFNDGWKFMKQKIGTDKPGLFEKGVNWYDVEVPHDWLIYDVENLYETSEGWYEKEFYIDDLEDKVVRICFEGVFMNSTVFVNEKEVGIWHNGYSTFEYNITSCLLKGMNTIQVRVCYEAPNSRWYSGAGIFRNVYLNITPPFYFESDGIYISTDGPNGNVSVSVEFNLLNKYIEIYKNLKLNISILNQEGVRINKEEISLNIEDYSEENQKQLIIIPKKLEHKLKVNNPILWDLESCYLYMLRLELFCDDILMDEKSVDFGFRTVRFDSNEGFFLNNKWMKLQGVCLHHDLGALGAAVNKHAIFRRLRMMKEMGANAIRTAHNMPAVELMDICDRLGLLVVSEAFDVWELKKDEYDYARFFDTDWEKDVTSWVRRDRNHPSLIMWSIGNEILDTHIDPRGLELARLLKNCVLKNDENENAITTIASNYITWENAQKVAMEVLTGYNYGENLYDDHHKKYPNWIIYGSETTSTVKSRGIYHFPAKSQIMSHEDLQCSSLDNSSVLWGTKNSEVAWTMDRDRKFVAGQFIWTGFDYIGESTPYSTKNSYFGLVDTAGFPKDIYYFYQSVWTDYKIKPMVHLLPYWDFNIGQSIDVFAYTNAPKVELFLNGESKGKQYIDHKHGHLLHGLWKLEYKQGCITVKAYDEKDNVIAIDEQRSFDDAASLVIKADKTELMADGRDVCYIEISAVDGRGNSVLNARNRIHVEVIGEGRLVGLDNGDSTDYEDYKEISRRLFSGKLIAIVQSCFVEGQIIVKVTSPELTQANIIIKAKPVKKMKGISVVSNNLYHGCIKRKKLSLGGYEVPVRKINLSIQSGSRHINMEQPITVVKADILPFNASYKELIWKIVNNNGIEINNATLEVKKNNEVIVKGVGDGDIRLRCMSTNGGKIPQVISELEFDIHGLGKAYKNPYQFNSACLYNLSNNPLTIIKDGAVWGFYEEIWIGFTDVDFGDRGTKGIRLYVGNCQGHDVLVKIWDGFPNNPGARIIREILIETNGEWQGFQPCKYFTIEQLTGIKTITFTANDKLVFGGFEFFEEDENVEER